MGISLALSETKSNISLSNEAKGDANLTWDEANWSWDEADGTWDNPKISLSKETKSKITLDTSGSTKI